MSIAVLEWAAYAQALHSQEEWLRWEQQPAQAIAALELAPALTEMSPMLRRRLSLTGRLACQAAYGATQAYRSQASWDHKIALVFATRYGDAHKSLAMLAELTAQRPVSPTGFGLAVHNAAGALFAMAHGYTNNMTVVTAGAQTVRAAFTESLGLLADGAPEVLLVSYDLPLPTPYQAFHSSDMPGHAWAMRLKHTPDHADDALRICWHTTPQQATPAHNPSLAALQQWLALQQPSVDATKPKALWI